MNKEMESTKANRLAIEKEIEGKRKELSDLSMLDS